MISINRTIKVLNKDLKERISIILKLSLTISIFYIAVFVITNYINNSLPFVTSIDFWKYYTTIVISLTTIISPILLYDNINKDKSGIDFIMLPASALEKFISITIVSFVITPMVLISSLTVISAFLNSIYPIAHPFNLLNHNIFGSLSYTSFGEYITFPSLFLLGNVYFKKQKVVKTLLMTSGIVISFMTLFVITFKFLFWSNINEIKHINMSVNLNDLDKLNYLDMYNQMPWLKFTLYLFSIIYYIIIPVTSLALSYRKIKTLQY